MVDHLTSWSKQSIFVCHLLLVLVSRVRFDPGHLEPHALRRVLFDLVPHTYPKIGVFVACHNAIYVTVFETLVNPEIIGVNLRRPNESEPQKRNTSREPNDFHLHNTMAK